MSSRIVIEQIAAEETLREGAAMADLALLSSLALLRVVVRRWLGELLCEES